MFVEGEQDPKPYKVDRVTHAGDFVSRAAEYATEAEAMAHRRRDDWHYRISIGQRQLWPVKKLSQEIADFTEARTAELRRKRGPWPR